MTCGKWGPALLAGIIAVAAAGDPHVIWRSSGLDAFEWRPGWRTYVSKDACERALASRQGRVARAVEILRRIGADDTLMHAVGDRVYRCRPAAPAPTAPSRRPSPESP
ncbi:MAG: hypothetical protein ACREKJ_04765 [Candidatus Rokuibacteriota bacterium]